MSSCREWWWVVLLGLLALGCGGENLANDAAAPEIGHDCPETYGQSHDYFPVKVSPTYATAFAVEYFGHYKVVRVLKPWRNAGVELEYVLVQCGTPQPEVPQGTLVIEVPVRSVVATSTTMLAQLVALGALERLVGYSEFDYVSAPEVRERIDREVIAEVGSGPHLNVERVLALRPDLVITDALGESQVDVHPKLLEAGLDVVLSGSYMEPTPLGRSEWIKFTALFFNEEAKANAWFDQVAERYEELSSVAQNVERRPTVVAGAPYQNVWHVPGGESYPAQYFSAAGARYLWAEEGSTGALPLDLESVYHRAVDAEFWLHPSHYRSLAEIREADERLADFHAVTSATVYNNDARLNEFGGNDYWETGAVRPDQVLADLIKIFHPELLPEHELFFYRKLE